MICCSPYLGNALGKVGLLKTILINRGGRDQDKTGFLIHDQRMLCNVPEVLFVLAERNMLMGLASRQARIVGTKENCLTMSTMFGSSKIR